MLQLRIFADDTNIFLLDKFKDMLVNRVNVELKLLSTWLKPNKLALILGKGILYYSELIENCSQILVFILTLTTLLLLAYLVQHFYEFTLKSIKHGNNT